MQEQQLTLRLVWRDYLSMNDLKPKTRTHQESMLERLLSDWLDLPMNSITKNMVLDKHRELSKRPVQANSAFRVLRTLYNFAKRRYEDEHGDSLIKRNPVDRLSEVRAWNKERPRSRFVPLNRIRDWLDAVLMLTSPTIRDYLIVLALTGFRHQECALLKWQEIDFRGKFINLPGSRTKNGEPHSLPLSTFLEAILLERYENRANEYVFPGGRWHTEGAMSSPYKAISVVKEQTGIIFSPHDLRRTFLVVARNSGVDEFTRKRLVNHSFQDVTGKHYSPPDPEELRIPMENISRRYLELADLA